MDQAKARAAAIALKEALARGRRADANAACRRLIELDAPMGAQWKAIATLLQHHGEHGLADTAAAVWVRQSEGSPPARFEHASVLARAGRLAEAEVELAKAGRDFPSRAAHAYTQGTIALNAGDIAGARKHLRAATAANPASGQSWLALAMAARLDTTDAQALVDAADAVASAPAVEQSAYDYALGKLHHDRREREQAFRAFERGAARMRRERSYDPAVDQAHARAGISGWDRPSIERLAGAVPSSRARPIFIAGLPRSGTTLVEQVLASHSRVDGGEELGLMRLVAQDAGGRGRGDLERFLSGGGSLDALRMLYEHLLAERFSGAGLVVDKTLDASRHIGLIATLFPEAPILWLRRDPLDCAWSAYRTWFARGLDWSWSLDSIAHHFRIEDELFAHWTRVLGDRILVVDYEEFVRSPEDWIACLSSHCGLELEPGQLTPHETVRTVTTASVVQVREGISASAIGAAEPYRRWLQPFIDAYGA